MTESRTRRLTPALRWFSIAMRSLHIAGTVLLGAAVLGNTPIAPGLLLAIATGVALCGIEWWRHPGYWRELAGIAIAVKLALLVAIAVVPALAAAVFWVVLIASSVVAHAAKSVRHRRILG